MKPASNEKITLVAIFGPTAVGKSRVAVEVAMASGGEIISADSMQVYRGLAVLTDQPAPEMLAAVPHHLVGEVRLSEEYSAGRFAREAAGLIAEISGRGRLPLLVGGTGLYIRALAGGFSFAGRPRAELRRKWEQFVRDRGAQASLRELERLDPEAAAAVDPANPRRLARALEAAEAGDGSVATERALLWSPASPYRVLSFGLEAPRERLYASIDARVETMLSSGAIDEVRRALAVSVSRTAAQAIGFADLADYLQGKITLEEAAALIRQKSRRYAKRQLTWMRKMPDIVRIEAAGRAPALIAQEIVRHISSNEKTIDTPIAKPIEKPHGTNP
jgi:tRNA dimethylallyltransferase